MRAEWYLVRFLGDKFVNRSPCALMRSEADNLVSLSSSQDDGYTYKVVHKNDLKDLGDRT